MNSAKSAITYPDFDKLDMRVGTIAEATAPEWSNKLLRFTVDFGAVLGKRTIFSGIQHWYTPKEFVGKQYMFLVNLEPKKMGEEESQGMMLMVDSLDVEGAEKPVPVPLQTLVENGTVVR